ncbi:exopolysaccharide biosynthesis polyprenyl glycosylphosphotransferase [Candidatus Peregrinibacteria bacterium]|nr:exopolysaccharide biosynthesis polyprenyl glycosylphosphotransferase [Candidatus Peregrinibacteria bacterium]
MKAQKRSQFHVLILLAGDIFVFVVSLIFALYIRNGFIFTPEIWEDYRVPFIILAIIWLFLLLAADFYNPRRTFSSFASFGNLTLVWFIWIFLSFGFFYLSPFFEITPKIVLVLDAVILYCVFIFWRWIFYKTFFSGPVTFALFGYNPHIKEFLSELHKRKSKFFKCAMLVVEPEQKRFLDLNEPYMRHIDLLDFNNVSGEVFLNRGVDYVITAEDRIKHAWADFFFHELFPLDIKIERFNYFFEESLQKVPVQSIDTAWFLENLDGIKHYFYDLVKRAADILTALILVAPAIVVSAIIILALAIERKTKIFYIQNRVARAGGVFRMYKFASMRPDAEKDGPKWSSGKGDERITRVGRAIRKLHFDEIPQLINILKGDMSFVGPRPERPEFVENLRKEIPFYYQRFLVKPGLSGWAQLNYPYGETVEDALNKLQYELYYIKHRSMLLDLEIFLRSFRLVFFQPKK